MSSLKNQVNPIVAVAAIAFLLLLAGFIYWRGTSTHPEDGAKPPGMPADAAAEFQKRMGSSTTTGAAKAQGAPSGPMRGGGYLAPPGQGGR